MARYFGTDGIRGKANIELDAVKAFKIGRYLGYYFSLENKQNIVIGKDTRLSSDMLENALASGIASEGCDVYLAGYCPTPMISYLVQNADFACGAMISASHNPYDDNGIKLFSSDGLKISADVEELIEDYLDGKSDIEFKTGKEIGRIYNYTSGLYFYLDYIKEIFPLDLSNYHLLLDLANGSSVATAMKVLDSLNANYDVINADPDGININTACGSTHTDRLKEKIKQGKYDLGLAFDGDADRMILVNSLGQEINGDYMLYVFAKYFKKKGMLKDNVIVSTVMANLGLSKALEKEDIKVEKTAVGDKYVFECMCEHDYLIGGEQSGHLIFKNIEKTGDGLVTALMFLKVMIEEGKSAIELCEGLRIYPQLLVNVKVSDKQKALDDKEILDLIDEGNQRLATEGRLFVRASGTESLVRVMAEAQSSETCAYEVNRIVDVVKKKYGV